MRFENFSLAYEGGIELQAFGHNWDLHNCVDFMGIRYEPTSGNVVLEWVPLPEYASNPWGDLENKATRCRLRFRDVSAMRLGPRKDGYPDTDASCVESIENVGSSLVFTMQNERAIEINASKAVLERDL